jgi:hypothetical protein
VFSDLPVELPDSLVAPSLRLVEASASLPLALKVGELVSARFEALSVSNGSVLGGTQRRLSLARPRAGLPACHRGPSG